MDLGVLLESLQANHSLSRVGACTCSFLPSCNSSVTLPWRGSRDLWLSHEAFPQGFPTRLSHKSFNEFRVVTPFPESPRCLSPFQGKLFSLHCLDFQAQGRLSPRWHVGQPCGKASWESFVGKPQGKASRESHRSLDPREGKRDSAATAREESTRACPLSRR